MNKFLSTLLICSAFGFYACNDFLQEETRGIISPDNFYTSDAEAILAINGVYADLRDNGLYGWWQGIHNFTQLGADILESSREFGENQPIQNYTLTESNYANARGTWEALYRLIGDANSVINNIRDNENISPEIQNQVIGEALFLRSFAYYHLTNLWGDVPYYEDELAISEVAALGRTEANEIRNQVISDLQSIEEENLLPSIYTSTDLGRPTLWAAKTLMAKIFMWQENWGGALAQCTDIINESPHQLLADYAAVFDVNNPFNEEVIWAIDFLKDSPGNAQTRTDGFNPRLRDEPKNVEEKGALSQELASRNEEFNGYGLTVPIPGFVNEFPEDDLRRPMNIMDTYLGFELTYQYMPKFINLNFINSPRGNHGEATLIFRLADVYLMAAEAENELNGPGNAYTYINAVRSRAYEPDQPYTTLGTQALREAIQDERRWELAGEGHRRYDLIRWGILLETVKNAEYRIYNPGENIQPYHVKLPIPEEELILNPKLLESDPTNNGYR
ncbi:RagB/SusD family nutrient uptake outer membrane protein [Catalinimonas niigatensis]|uniref:RagB/SusD family nutrient uptake outer membrane protein n=1 Tax=Catalinimonas niigatensis TaxID=1397264 RepID=UPI0026659C29|nr:RagB/SusD family nutrient uptake outer membrane protein [Catalinimonas niigatensis]WPP49200.1 RagB/SusD family nutrient uptake outer membrane protein [Catalinimonas niigatensis]